MKRKRERDDALYARMLQVMAEKRLYLRKHLSRDDVAREVLTNRTYLTRALKGRGLNFAQFVNSYRAQHAIGLLFDPRYREASPADIAEMSGFATVEAMNRYVKKSAGSTACAMRKRVLKD